MEKGRTHWIWLKEWTEDDGNTPCLVLFRRKLQLQGDAVHAFVKISADSRYKLYVNGRLVEAGPCKGDMKIWYQDELDLKPFIRPGENVIAVEVLRYPTEMSKGNYGICRTAMPGLFITGEITDSEGRTVLLGGDERWKAKKNEGYQIVSESDDFAPLRIYEKVAGVRMLKGWKLPDYEDGDWQNAMEYTSFEKAPCLERLHPRPIPFLYRKCRRFAEIVTLRESDSGREQWEGLIKNGKKLTIGPGRKEVVEISAGEEMTGFLRIGMTGGAGGRITILQSESYVTEEHRGSLPVKGDRMDWKGGHLEGFSDSYEVAGYGEETCLEEYEPFWFRTFRFIQLVIETSDEPLSIYYFDYAETGYPLEVKTKISTSSERMNKIWEISERTLRRCMHETYEDCPFYEQLQYAMDSRSQILYTYSVSGDDRLARKCMDDFRRAQNKDGLLNSFHPSMVPHVIPGFSIYYVGMLYDHMMYFGEKHFLEQHLSVMDGILQFFHEHRTKEGYVERIGGLNGKAPRWSFIDWAKEWDATTGVPPAILKGPITMESLLYILGLQYASRIMEYLGRMPEAAGYRDRAVQVQKAVRKYCSGKSGLLQDGPGIEEYSQQTQVFAALTDTVGSSDAKRNLEETILHKERYAQCSVAMAFYLFRALEKTGLYAYTKEYWGIWDKMIQKNATTCVEDDVGERSDCHAWGALALYELPAVILGVRPAAPGYECVEISPRRELLEAAAGSVTTPYGQIGIQWEKGKSIKYDFQEIKGLERVKGAGRLCQKQKQQ